MHMLEFSEAYLLYEISFGDFFLSRRANYVSDNLLFKKKYM